MCGPGRRPGGPAPGTHHEQQAHHPRTRTRTRTRKPDRHRAVPPPAPGTHAEPPPSPGRPRLPWWLLRYGRQQSPGGRGLMDPAAIHTLLQELFVAEGPVDRPVRIASLVAFQGDRRTLTERDLPRIAAALL